MEVPIPEKGIKSKQVEEALVAGVSMESLFDAGFTPASVGCVYSMLRSRGLISVIPRATGMVSRAQRRYIYRRDKYRCQFCRKVFPEEKLQPHHIDHNRRNNRSSNVETTCVWCNHAEGKIYTELLMEAKVKGEIGELERLEVARDARAKAKKQLQKRLFS